MTTIDKKPSALNQDTYMTEFEFKTFCRILDRFDDETVLVLSSWPRVVPIDDMLASICKHAVMTYNNDDLV